MRFAYSFFVFVFFFSSIVTAQVKSSADTIKYPWLHPQVNILQFYNRQALAQFYESWKQVGEKKFSILQLGDSHLQNEVYPAQFRKRIQDALGDAGQGLMFSFSAVKMYDTRWYKTTHTGIWQGARSVTTRPKLPLGVRGMTCRTQTAGASLSFSFVNNVPSSYNVLKVFCKKDINSYDFEVEIGSERIPVTVDSSQADVPYITVPIPAIKNKKITLRVVKSNPDESFFEFYGMSLETNTDKGVIVHNAGVGAAQYKSILAQKLFEEQLPAFEADVFVIGFGTNDYLYTDKIEPALEGEIRKVIQTIRNANPQASIILTTAQDLYYKGLNVKSGADYQQLIHKIAKDTDCAVFDWYWISGGQRTMLKWVQSGLAQSDRIHLAWQGSELKGNLLYEAMADAVQFLEQNPDSTQRLFPTEKLVVKKQDTPPATVTAPKNTKTHYHLISAGETLFAIARKYGVTVPQIKTWNGLQSDTIYAGKRLIIYLQ